ncbi:G-type lectin S-receptor-like serine/threonine-protein kinase [Populus alba x Populus x berolinensis]|nr:G-type lectin S-receptor-like serine/threonine-protein kinase [Populus alba x Populus x berolinensis]
MDSFPSLLFCFSLLLIIAPSTAVDSINTTQPFKDGDFLVSAGGSFKLGFSSFGTSSNRYLCIWYNQISTTTVAWVANRETPINDSSGVLRITSKGILVLLDQTGSAIWSSNSSRPATNPVAQLLDSGNLVVREEGDSNLENSLWQSFDYPGDTFLPEMKLGRNTVTGLDRYISSWKSSDDPSRGNWTYRLDPAAYSELIVREDSTERFRSGPWNGLRFSGTPQLKLNTIYTYRFVYDSDEEYYTYQLVNNSFLSRMVINQNGAVQRFTWIDRTQSWDLYLTVQTDNCDRYALCGAYATCSINNSPVCNCLDGFTPKIRKDWDTMDWSGGCDRRTKLNCSGDGFRKFTGIKLPETRKSWFNRSMSLDECRSTCQKNCSCTAYANLDISNNGGSGCLLWFSDLIDMRQFNENGQEIYIRMAGSELGNAGGVAKSKEKKQTLIIILVPSVAVVFLSLALFLLLRRKKRLRKRKMTDIMETSQNNKGKEEDLELPLFDISTMSRATDDFSAANILGQGGFGTVYKGILKDGQEIAVKRLSKTSKQGLDEFKNEVKHIVKLQHRNLVKLLGCCIEADEMMLIYEFMPNKSLDFIFDKTRNRVLDWSKRFHIINGIARGLLYLHQDSRLRIIHRDLKASNILLDDEMNPKISDFGLARSVGGSETEANTNKVVGTYGYISPEYAIDGLYSVKSDVFSFGVMVLEIVSGKRNKGFCHPDSKQDLLGYAWRLFIEGGSSELIAESIVESCNLYEAVRSIQIGLLCVQRSPRDRPSMSTVVMMLGSESELPQPKEPGFFTTKDSGKASSSSIQSKISANEITMTQLEAR